MSKIQMVAAPDSGQNGITGATPSQGMGVVPLDTSRVFLEVGGSIDSVRDEVDDAFKDMNTFLNREPDEIMRMCGGHSARLAEIRLRIHRIEDFHRQWRPIRLREIEPALDQLQNQYRIASRLHSCREFDWKVEAASDDRPDGRRRSAAAATPGFRVWWRRWHDDSDKDLDNAHLMRMAGRFARRVRAWAAANQVPVIDCKAEERKHRIAEDYLREHAVGVGVFLILVARAPATAWKVSRSNAGVIRIPMPR
jgi:hypothetical protein